MLMRRTQLRSLPPCGGGLGRGVAANTALRVCPNRSLGSSSDPQNTTPVAPHARETTPLTFVSRGHPPPCPSPARGEGTLKRRPSEGNLCSSRQGPTPC